METHREKAERFSSRVIAAAIEVHRHLGPGLLESIYEKCLARELTLAGLTFKTQIPASIEYKGVVLDETLRVDFLVEDCIVIELKSVQEIIPIFKAQTLSYMKLLSAPVGLLMNFNSLRLVDGLHRLVLKDSTFTAG